MELSSRLQEAVIEVYSKKYSVNIDKTEVCFGFEKKLGESTGIVSVYVDADLFSRVDLDFDTSEALVLSDVFTCEELFRGASFDGISKKGVVAKAVESLKQYIRPECEDSGIDTILEEADSLNEHKYQLLIKESMPEFASDTISFHPSMIFKKDIVCDELLFIEFIMAIESQFDIDIPDDDLDGDITYGQLLSIIQSGNAHNK